MATKGYRKKRRQTNKRKRKQKGGGMFDFLNKLNPLAMTQEKALEQKNKCTKKCQEDYDLSLIHI